MTVVITVNRNRVRANLKHGLHDPVLRISNGKHGKPYYADEFAALGTARVLYRPEKPLPCGARAWIEIDPA